MAQILKALGFDKCKPSVLNIVTDLYIKHLQLVVGKAQKFALARTNCSNSIDVPDVLQAFLAAGTVKPLRFGSVDSKDEDDESNTKSGEAFQKWLKYSDQYSVSKKLSEVPSSLIHNLMEKRRIDTSAETDQERKKRRLKERQDFYNQLKQGEDVNQMEDLGRFVDELDEDEINADDRLSWLTYLAEKDLKLGHNLKFVNSCIQDSLIAVHNNPKFHPTAKDGEQVLSLFHNNIVNNTKNDHILLQIHDIDMPQDGETQASVVPSSQLKEVLPYNVKYNLVLCDDSLDQYIAYASAHTQEIEDRLRTFDSLDGMEVDTPVKDPDSEPIPDESEKTVPADQDDEVSIVNGEMINTELATDKIDSTVEPVLENGMNSDATLNDKDTDNDKVQQDANGVVLEGGEEHEAEDVGFDALREAIPSIKPSKTDSVEEAEVKVDSEDAETKDVSKEGNELLDTAAETEATNNLGEETGRDTNTSPVIKAGVKEEIKKEVTEPETEKDAIKIDEKDA